MAQRYVDSAATGANNGTSWTDAWTSLASLSGVSAGDTVNISGGTSGKSYSAPGGLTLINGTSDAVRTIYRVGQDAGHTGPVTIDLGGNPLFSSANRYITVSGNSGDGTKRLVFENLQGLQYTSSATAGQSITVEYVDGGEVDYVLKSDYAEQYEIGHCYFKKVPSVQDFAITGNYWPATGYGLNRFHHNTILVPFSGSGFGDDCFSAASGSDIYNNSIEGYFDASYSASQHGDGIQVTLGSYVRIYSNMIANMANSGIFPSPIFGNVAHWRIYNNIIKCTSASYAGTPVRGIDINSGYGTATGFHYIDVVVANNLCVDLSGPGDEAAFAIRFDDDTSKFTFTNCFCYNNISLNAGGIVADPTVSAGDNVTVTYANGTGHFEFYEPFNAANDFRLSPNDTTFRAQGTDMSAYFTTDYTGATRILWSIGAFDFPALSLNITTLNATTLTVG